MFRHPIARLARHLAACIGLALMVSLTQGAEKTERSVAEGLWTAHVQPLFSQHCFKCHGELKQKSNLDLTSPAAILKGGDNGPGIVPGQPEQSLIYKSVLPGAEQHMPPKDYQLNEDELTLIRKWIAALPSSNKTTGNSVPEWSGSDYPLVQANVPKVLPPKKATSSEAIDFYLDRERSRFLVNASTNSARKPKTLKAARASDDRTFARRAYLDLLGRIPTAKEQEQFLSKRGAGKRKELIEHLLASPEHPRHLREVFDVVLMGKRSRDNKWATYLEWAFQTNRPWNQIVQDLLLARPEKTEQRGAVRFLYDRKDNHQAIVEAVSPALFGLQIQCAQCHNHPLAPEIKQKHYWGMVAFFNRGKNIDTPNGPAISESAIGGFVKFANLKKESQDAVLAFLNDDVIAEKRPGDNEKETDTPDKYRLTLEEGKKAGFGAVPKFSRREQFVELATKDNPLLARAMVNRVWAMLMGRGLVHPVDRMDSAHPPSHPDLLAWLARDFEQNGYDLKHLLRAIANTRAYAGDSNGSSSSAPALRPEAFAHPVEKMLSGEALCRSMLIATGERDVAASDLPQFEKHKAAFAETFPDLFPIEANANLKQALFLTNNRFFEDLLKPGGTNLLARLNGLSAASERVKEAFLSVLGRLPAPAELEQARSYLESSRESSSGNEHLVWALLTGAEFRLNY